MIGRTTSAKPASSRMFTNRDSMRLRRAVSSTSSGLTPVGYRNFFSTNKKPPPRDRRGGRVSRWSVWQRPFPIGARNVPLHHVVMVVMQGADVASGVHKSEAGYHGTETGARSVYSFASAVIRKVFVARGDVTCRLYAPGATESMRNIPWRSV